MIQKSIEWHKEEIRKLERAPYINGCEMTDEWAELIEIHRVAVRALEMMREVR